MPTFLRRGLPALTLGLDVAYLYALFLGSLWTWPWVILLFWGLGALAGYRLLQLGPCIPRAAALYPVCALLPLTALRRVTEVEEPAARDSQLLPQALPRHDDRPRRFGLAALLALVLAGSLSNHVGHRVLDPALAPVDDHATAYLQRTFIKAGASFAMARVIDRAVAVVSHAEVSPFGFSFQPGQLFKPIQDMAVRYADFMVVVMAIVGGQIVIMEIAGTITVPVMITAVALVLLLAVMLPERARLPVLRIAGGLTVLTVALRLLIPVIALLVSAISAAVLDDRRERIESEIGVSAQGDVAALDEEEGIGPFLGRLRDQLSESVQTVRSFANDIIGKLVDLMVIYMLEVIVAPALILSGLYYLQRRLRAPPPRRVLQQVEQDPPRLPRGPEGT